MGESFVRHAPARLGSVSRGNTDSIRFVPRFHTRGVIMSRRSTCVLFSAVIALCAASTPAFGQNAAAVVDAAAIRAAGGPAAGGPAPNTPADSAYGDSKGKGSKQPAMRSDARHLFTGILKDQRAIALSPFHLHGSDMKWFLPSAVGIGAAFAADREVEENLGPSSTRVNVSKRVSVAGAPATVLGAAGAMYFVGRMTSNDRLRETGLLSVEAVVDQFIVVASLKQVTNRERPNRTNGNTEFYDGGTAFPSGTAGTSWALAAVVGEEYKDKPLVRWGVYGLATAVSVARVTELKHAPSDGVGGGLIGCLIGRHVAHSVDGKSSRSSVLPYFNAATRSYGLTYSVAAF